MVLYSQLGDLLSLGTIENFSENTLIFMVVCMCSNIRVIRMRQEVEIPQVSKCLNIIIYTTICVGSEDAEILGASIRAMKLLAVERGFYIM